MEEKPIVKEKAGTEEMERNKIKDELLRIYTEKMDPIECIFFKKGFEKGFEEGIRIGENNVNKSFAVNLYESGYKPERIAEMLEVSLEQVMEWIEEK